MKDNNTLTRSQLSKAVYREIGLSKIESGELVEAVLEEIIQALLREERVKLSSFGSFLLRYRGSSLGRNPQTGQETPVPPRYFVSFKPSHILREHVNIYADEKEE